MAYNNFEQVPVPGEGYPLIPSNPAEHPNFTPSPGMNMPMQSPSSLNYTQMKVHRPCFKGSVEDLVMITNFKRFKRKGSSSKYKGVFFVKKEKKYRAQICLKGKKKYVGTFKNDHDAAIARDKRIREMFGEVEELLNFPASKNENRLANPQNIQDQPPPAIPEPPPVQGSTLHTVRNRLSNLTRYSSAASQGSFGNVGMGYTPYQYEPYQQYNNYNPLMGLNFQEIAIPRPRAVLAKRFSSSDSTLSFLNQNGNNFQLQDATIPTFNVDNNATISQLQTKNEPQAKRLKTK